MRIDIRTKREVTTTIDQSIGPWADGAGSPHDDVFHVEFEVGDDAVSDVVVRSVAALRDRPSTALDPLAETVNPEVLESIVEEGARGSGYGGEFSFEYEGFEITVVTDGHIWLERL